MWIFVGLIFRIMFMGATITPGAELIPGGYILLVIVVTYWWVVVRGKKAWLCYGIQVGSDKSKTAHVGKGAGHMPSQNIAPLYNMEQDMTDPLKCPRCGAVSTYRKADIIHYKVMCQNCLEYFNV